MLFLDTPILCCPSCGFENREGAEFCNECAVPLTAEPPAPKPQTPISYTPPYLAKGTRQELFLQTTLGPALMVTKGFTAPEVEKAYNRGGPGRPQEGSMTAKLAAALRGSSQKSLGI